MTIAIPTITETNVVLLRVLDALLSLHEISEAQIDLPNEGASVLKALRWHLGPDIELATMHRRIHRWLVDGREVVLNSLNGHRTCLRVA